jgi:Amt family ammonium transporter
MADALTGYPVSPVDGEALNIAWILLAAALVMFMQVGFCCLESGLVRSKNSINVAIKNLVDFCLAGLIFWAFGFGLMFGQDQGGLIGHGLWFFNETGNTWLVAFFIFQMVFCGTAITIISGAVAERMRFSAYVVVAVLVSGIIYPVFGHWAWGSGVEGEGQGWLAARGFIDFAGSTVVHSTGAWVALAAILVIGPRSGHFTPGQSGVQGHNLPLAAIGVLILWFGWFGFNGGSTLALNSNVPTILINTNLAAAVGGITALTFSWSIFRKPKVVYVLNGILGGLVAITANCHIVTPREAVVIGAIGGLLAALGILLLRHLKVDDAVGAVPAHGLAGIWGTLAVAIFGNTVDWAVGTTRWEQLSIQGQGILACFAWSFGLAYLVFRLINRIHPMRVTRDQEHQGLNVSEHDATTELVDLISEMEMHRAEGRFTGKVYVEPHTEVGQIATVYNQVLDRVVEEMGQREVALMSLGQAKREAEEANRVKSDFLANMSHELRTPLGVIMGYTELLQEEFNREEQNRQHLNDIATIQEASQHLLNLIDGVLDIAKIEAGQMEMDLEPIAVKPLVESLAKIIAPLAKKNNNQVEVVIAPDAGEVFADQTKLKQCLLNLIGNACKFTERGIIRIIVSREERHQINFIVEDTGIGMNRDQIRRIFDPFTQADTSMTRRYGGTGLGLTITKSYCEMMGGKIHVESTLGRGSIFTLIFPINQPYLQQTTLAHLQEKSGSLNISLSPSHDNTRPIG